MIYIKNSIITGPNVDSKEKIERVIKIKGNKCEMSELIIATPNKGTTASNE